MINVFYDMTAKKAQQTREHYQGMITEHLAAGNEHLVQVYHSRLVKLNRIRKKKEAMED